MTNNMIKSSQENIPKGNNNNRNKTLWMKKMHQLIMILVKNQGTLYINLDNISQQNRK